MQYRRARVPGGCYFFTVVTWRRQRFLASESVRRLLGEALRVARQERPFWVEAIVLLPDHLHCIWTLPEGDADFPGRWRHIRRFVTMRACLGRIWQGRYWEHLIRDPTDFRHHVEYIHYNPVRHGFVASPREWAYSSFHRFVADGRYPMNWGESEPVIPEGVGRE